MHPTDRFTTQAPQLQKELQPDCPVYVHCTRLSREKRSGREFIQLRLVNCSEKQVNTVSFVIRALDADGGLLAAQGELVLADCKARPGRIFGEEKLFTLQLPTAKSLRIEIKRVAFADGMLWRSGPEAEFRTPEELGWKKCSCGLPNAPERIRCPLCGRELLEKKEEEEPLFSLPEPVIRRPAPIIRREMPLQTAPSYEEEEEEEEGVPVWLKVLLCICGGLAVLAMLGFAAFCLQTYIL